MATGTVRDSLQNVRTLKLAHTAAVTAGDVIVSNGQVLVAVNTALINAVNAYVFRGKTEFPKEPSLAINVGDVCYWLAASGYITKTVGSNTKTGICVEAALAADEVALVMLDENK